MTRRTPRTLPILAVAVLAVVTVATLASAGLPRGCTREATDDGLDVVCEFHDDDSVMRDTYVRADRPTGRYNIEDRLELILNSQDRAQASLILLDRPNLPLLPNATLIDAALEMTVRETDVPRGTELQFGAWGITEPWNEAVPWTDRPDPRSPWRTPPASTWTLPATGVADGDVARWDVAELLEGRITGTGENFGIIVTNRTQVPVGVGGPEHVLRFHSSRVDQDLRPTLTLRARTTAPQLASVTIDDAVLWRNGSPTEALLKLSGAFEYDVHVVLEDTGAVPGSVRLNFTRADAPTRSMPIPLSHRDDDGVHYTRTFAPRFRDGGYRLEVWAIDGDGYPINVTATGVPSPVLLDPSRAQVLVDSTRPVIHMVDAPVVVDEGATAVVRVEAGDPDGATPLTVTATTVAGGVRNDVTLRRVGGDRFEERVPFDVAGQTVLTIRATDGAANTATEQFEVRVVDRTPPTLSAVAVDTPLREASTPATEAGLPVSVVATAHDDTPVVVHVNATGPEHLDASAPVVNGTAVVPFLFHEPGTYSLRVTAVNVDGLQSAPRVQPFVVVAARPPTITLPDGLAEGVLAIAPRITVAVEDASLNASRVHLNVTVDGDAITPAVQTVLGATRVEYHVEPENLVNGTTLGIDVVARDQLGLLARGRAEWTVDGRGPDTDVAADGPHVRRGRQMFVGAQTELRVVAHDALLGTQNHQFAVMRAGVVVERIDAEAPLSVHALRIQPGVPVTLVATADDLAGNPGASEPVTVVLDAQPPEVSLDATPTGVRLGLTDAGAGVDRLVARAAIGDEPYIEYANITADPGSTEVSVPIPTSAPRGTTVHIQMTATDRLGNTVQYTSERPLRATIPNHPPAVTILGPTAATRVGGEIVIAWSAGDLDGDRVSSTVRVERVLDGQLEPVVRNSEADDLRLETTRFLNGPHLIHVEATDGEDATTQTIEVTFDNPGRDAGRATASPTPEGLVVEVPVAQAIAELTVHAAPPQGPTLSARARDDGRGADLQLNDGIWTAVLPVHDPGRYTLTVTGVAADGSPVEADVGEASIEGVAVSGIVPWLLAASLVAGGTGVAVAWWRRLTARG